MSSRDYCKLKVCYCSPLFIVFLFVARKVHCASQRVRARYHVLHKIEIIILYKKLFIESFRGDNVFEVHIISYALVKIIINYKAQKKAGWLAGMRCLQVQ